MGGRKLQGMLIVTVGLPASGKTSWVKGFIEDNKDKTIDIISSDKIREEMFNDIEDQNHNGEVFDLMKRRTKESLSQGHVVVYEATNISSKRRRALLKELKRYYDKAICLFKYKNVVDCDIDNCIREKKVPNDVIERMYKNFEIPPCTAQVCFDILCTRSPKSGHLLCRSPKGLGAGCSLKIDA